MMSFHQTQYLKGNISSDVQKAARLLQAGETVAFATETVYGLGALGLSAKAVEKIYEAKGRPAYNPLIFHVSSQEQALGLWAYDKGCRFEHRAQVLMTHFWPGPLTLVGAKQDRVPSIACGGLSTVAVRMPAHPVAQSLIEAVGEPLVAPSANASNRPSSTCAKHVLQTLEGKIAAVLDGGDCQLGLESTIVDLLSDRVCVLRLGSISAEAISAALGEEVDVQTKAKDSLVQAPGQLGKHYAPLVSHIVLTSSEAVLMQAWQGSGALLLRYSTAVQLRQRLGERIAQAGLLYELPDDPVAYARQLYAAFYALEQYHPTSLTIEDCAHLQQEHAMWQSIQDRLVRASA